jgi:hypothetical protein
MPTANQKKDSVIIEDTPTNKENTLCKASIEKALKTIIDSPIFQTSKQSQKLLTYIVHHSLLKDDNLLRERVIGSQVFDRAPNYDAANDPVVRARVSEVRKRLAQYYLSNNPVKTNIRIEIPVGSYRASFKPIEPKTKQLILGSKDENFKSSNKSIYRFIASKPYIILGFILLCCVPIIIYKFYYVHSNQDQAFQKFWSPVLNNKEPVLIYTGTNVVYRFSPDFLDRYRNLHHVTNNGPEFVINFDHNEKIDSRDILSSSNSYVTTGDVSACAAIISMLAHHNKQFELRYAEDISPSDLRASPTVLIGAFNNPWTLYITHPLRFAFMDGRTIVDQFNNKKSWSVMLDHNGKTIDDYAIITKMRSPQTGKLLLTAAGIGQNGTQAASEFLSNPQQIQDFVNKAPINWDDRNFQIVLHVKVTDEIPSSVNIVETYFW